MYWDCITFEKMGPLIEVKGNLNSQNYISNILEAFEKFWKKVRKKRKCFMQDNAPCHRSKLVEQWFGSKKMKILQWPPQSPDLNPIETIWDILLKRVRENNRQLASLTEFREKLKEEWEIFPIEIVQDLYKGLPNRLKELKKMKGNPTKY